MLVKLRGNNKGLNEKNRRYYFYPRVYILFTVDISGISESINSGDYHLVDLYKKRIIREMSREFDFLIGDIESIKIYKDEFDAKGHKDALRFFLEDMEKAKKDNRNFEDMISKTENTLLSKLNSSTTDSNDDKLKDIKEFATIFTKATSNMIAFNLNYIKLCAQIMSTNFENTKTEKDARSLLNTYILKTKELVNKYSIDK